MTVSSTITRVDFAGTGITGPYGFPFRIFAATDLQVVVRSAAGAETILSYISGFTISTGAVGNRAGGTVTLVNPLPADGSTLTIRRAMAVLQPTEIRNQGTYFPETVEDMVDRGTMIDQQQQEQLDRSLKLNATLSPAGRNLSLNPAVAGAAVVADGLGGFTMAPISPGAVALPGGRTVTSLSVYLADNAVFNVRDGFNGVVGAKGDGATDDRLSLQAASDACHAAGGGILLVPPGTYLSTVAAHPQNGTYFQALIIYSNVTLVGAGSGAAVIKLAANQSGSIVRNFDITSGTDRNIHVRDIMLDGNGPNQSGVANAGLDYLRLRSGTVTRVVAKNVRGTALSGPGEGFHFNAGLCSDLTYLQCVAYGDAGSTASGFSANQCTGLSYEQCTARGMTVTNGFTHNGCAEIRHVNCHAYLNAQAGFNSESTEGVYYLGCTAGGRSIAGAMPWFTAGQSLGNTVYGFVINGSTKWSIVGGSSRYNGQGIFVGIGSTYGLIDDIDISANARGIQIHPSAVPTTRIGDTVNVGNTVAALEVPGGIGQSVLDADALIAPAVPASTVALTNPFPFVVAVTVGGGTVTAITVNAAVVTASGGTFLLNPGWTIKLTYSAAPGWLWVKA